MASKIFKKLSSVKVPKLKKHYIYSIDLKNSNTVNKLNNNIEILILNDFIKIIDLKKKNYILNNIEESFIKKAFQKNCKAIFVFSTKILAHVSWFTFDKIGKKIIDPISPFENNNTTVYWGTAYTFPKYRNIGISKIAMKECFIYSKKMKFKNLVLSVRTTNIPAIKSYEYFNPRLNGIAYSLNILWYNLRYYINSEK